MTAFSQRIYLICLTLRFRSRRLWDRSFALVFLVVRGGIVSLVIWSRRYWVCDRNFWGGGSWCGGYTRKEEATPESRSVLSLEIRRLDLRML